MPIVNDDGSYRYVYNDHGFNEGYELGIRDARRGVYNPPDLGCLFGDSEHEEDPLYGYDEGHEAYGHLCPCCENSTLSQRGHFEVCPVCNWEDDPIQSQDTTYTGGANTMSLEEARVAYGKVGTAFEEYIGEVNLPPKWKFLLSK